MDSCSYIDVWPADVPLSKSLSVLDVLTLMAYLVIPVKLIYFVRLSPVLPDKREIIYFAVFSIFSGAHYLTNLQIYSETVTQIVKVGFTPILWLTVLVLNSFFKKVFNRKQRELILDNKVEDLSLKMSLQLQQEETKKSFDKVINQIRSTIDWQCILKSTVVGLGKTLNLEECAMWLPSQANKTLLLSHCMNGSVPGDSTVPMSLPVLAEVFGSAEPVRIPLTSPLVKATSICQRCIGPEVVAIRVPLPQNQNIERDNRQSTSAMSYAVMVLVPSSDCITMFSDDELKLVTVVAEQVAVALDHASAVRKSAINYDNLKTQNSSLTSALRETEMAFLNLNFWYNGFLNQMLNLQNILPFLLSYLLETALTPEQRLMVETVLRSSSSLETLMESARDLSKLQDGSLELRSRNFDLSATINQAVDKVKPVAVIKKLLLSLSLAPNLPDNAIGDQERLMQIILNILANAVRFTKEGNISVTASVANPNSIREWWPCMVTSKNHFYLKIQVEDSGCGIDPYAIPHIFNGFINTPNQSSGGGLGLPICKQLLKIMEGDILVESDGLGKGTTVTVIVKLKKSAKAPSAKEP